jgi:uncharacterized repeat protein (TIGR01451 family)
LKYRLVAILALVIGLVACGGGGSSSSGGTESPPAAGEARVSLTASGSTTPVPAVTNTDLDFVVANAGTADANNVVLTVTLGNGLSKGGVLCSASGGAICPGDPQTMSASTLPAGGSLRFTVSAIVAGGATGVITSTGSVTASNDQVASNKSAQVSITAYSADVQVVGSVSASDLHAGSSATYSYTVRNAGPDAARNVSLKQTVSSAQTITAMTCTAGGGATCPATTDVQMAVPSLPSGGTLSFSVTTQLVMDAVVSVSSTLNATALGDGDISNNKAEVSAKTRIPTSPGSPTFVKLQSDTGDFVGGEFFTLAGRDYSYTGQNAVFEVRTGQGSVSITIRGDDRWDAVFYMPGNLQQLQVGEYIKNLGATYDPAAGGFSFGGRGNGCDQSGWFIVDDVVYAAGALVSLDLRFEQHCDGLEPALRGQIHWIAGDATQPPGPVNPPPGGLWDADPGATPASGNYVYIQSDPDDFIGQGRTETYTQLDAILHVEENAGLLTVSVIGDRDYLGSFRVMAPRIRIEPGYYGNAQGLAWNPTVGGLDFSGDGRGCNAITGWFVIDNVSFSSSSVTAVDLRFEQHCEGVTAALRGKIHWRSDDPTQPVGPQLPPPAGLWTPPAGAVPATGNVVYLQSEPGDWVGQGLTSSYTSLDSVITVGGGGMTPVENRFQLTVNGDGGWTGYFQAMNTLANLQPGYYGNLLRFPGNNPTMGGLSWSGYGRGCNTASGWFVIDSVTYSGSSLDSIELRFEQNCEETEPPLHGYIRWSAANQGAP